MTRPQEIQELIEYHEKEVKRLQKELEQVEYQEVYDGTRNIRGKDVG